LEFKTFPSKILLFGEYTTLLGGDALALPYSAFTTSWAYGGIFKNSGIVDHLRAVVSTYPDLRFKEHAWYEFIGRGGYLFSTIPMGYGLGSSGSVVAALVHDFVDGVDSHWSSTDLLKLFATIESFFHGKSSGIDPLVIYLNCGVIKKNGEISVLPELKLDDNWSLVDSHMPRNTESLVNKFKEAIKDERFRLAVEKIMVLQNNLIECYLSEYNYSSLMRELSIAQYETFGHLIPNNIKAYWQEGLTSGRYSIKLCGAGGGGFFLKYEAIRSMVP
jgi:mevalonate kinase